MTDTFAYRAFGLAVESDLALPELAACTMIDQCGDDAGERVTISAGLVDGPIIPPDQDRCFIVDGDGLCFAWRDLARVRVTQARKIVYACAPDAARDALALALLGPVFASILHQRGRLVLHGAALTKPSGEAVLFVGDSGAGKSTMAAACILDAWGFLSDDVVALDWVNSGEGRSPVACALPAYPTLKLSAESRAALPTLPGTLLPQSPSMRAKRRLRLPQAMEAPDEAVSVSAVCILSRGATVQLERCSATDAVGHIIRFAYPLKFGMNALPSGSQIRLFQQASALASSVPVYRLEVPDDIAAIATVPTFLRGALTPLQSASAAT